jgi:NAD(P)-dependent dehydrogenase (short-subunit alcohol dehydrogenase family)
VASFGRLDFAFNNAGIEGQPADTVNCTEENWDRTINTNLKGVWLCMKYEIPEMLKSGGGAIVNCSSVAGLVGFSGIPAYDASKHGVVGLTQSAALEFVGQNIRINAVCPGVIRTPMIDRFTGGNTAVESQLLSNQPIGRMGTPEEVANLVVWLCSEESSFVVGQAIAIDGGWTTK